MKATNSFIAGGASLYWAMNEAPPLASDIDFWIPIPKTIDDADSWTDLIKTYFNAIIPNKYTQVDSVFDKYSSKCNPYSEWQGAEDRIIHSIVNFISADHGRLSRPFPRGTSWGKLQLIFVQVPDGKNAIDVIPRSFDLNICQFVVSPTKSGLFECKHAVLSKEEADELIKHRVFDVIGTPTTGKQALNIISRIEKYYKRGFSLATKTVVVKFDKIPDSVAFEGFHEKYKELIMTKLVQKVMKNTMKKQEEKEICM